MSLEVPVLYRSPDDIIVIKPAGLSTERPGAARGDHTTLVGLIQREFPDADVKLPHRLDRLARGIVVIALTPQAIAFHNTMIREKRWRKHYLARVATSPGVDRLLGEHRAYLIREGTKARSVRSGGAPSFMTIAAVAPAPDHPDRTDLLIELKTGRYHQIRIMLAELGFPLAGDALYGSREQDLPILEHIVLKLPLAPGEPARVMHLADDPGRPRLHPTMQRAIDELVRESPSESSPAR